jgi:putative transposase
MGHSYIATFIHLVFSTKNRKDTIPSGLNEKLGAYLFGIANHLGMRTLAIGGTSNHIHILLALPPTIPVAEAAQKLKANSSRWLGEQGLEFQWQEGYGAFSVSPSLVDAVRRYVRNQEEHHKKRSFEDEFRLLLEKSGVVFDPEKLFAA